MKDWYRSWFDSDYYLKVYKHRDDKDAEKLANLILQNVKLKNDTRILDAACGSGRHSNYFASLGFNVTAFDLSKSLLAIAQKNSLRNNRHVDYINADLRNFHSNAKFDIVVNLFTSFGYFETDEENFLFPKNIFNSIEYGGFYVLDYLNKNFIESNLISSEHKKIDDIGLYESREIKDSRLIKKIKIKMSNELHEFYESVKLYSKEEILENFRTIGYKENKIYGDYNSSKFDKLKSPRLIIIFTK